MKFKKVYIIIHPDKGAYNGTDKWCDDYTKGTQFETEQHAEFMINEYANNVYKPFHSAELLVIHSIYIPQSE